jgi:hypothetical protein
VTRIEAQTWPEWLTAPRRLGALVIVLLVFRAWFAWALPMTGDEAYFTWWGWQPDWGFYDHPPMIGWWLAGLLRVSDAPWWLRLPSILLPLALCIAVAWTLPRLIPGLDEARRNAIALLVMLAPINVWNVLITTDTPLVYFSVFSALAWLRAAQERAEDGYGWYLLSGVLLAGAVLSKYFVAFLGFAYLIDVARRRSRKAWAGLAIAYAACLPALALMAWWNAANCWSNYMFNFVNRHGSAHFSLQTPLLYILSLVYALSPPTIWYALRRPASADFRHDVMARGTLMSMATLAGVPLVLFALLSGPKTIGLHWLLSFIPLAMLWFGLRASSEVLVPVLKWAIGIAAAHMIAFAVIAALPLDVWKKTKFFSSAVLTVDHRGFAAAIAADRADQDKRWVLAMDGYSNAVTLGYNLRQHVAVFGVASSHARHDDIQTDWRALDDRNILILRKTAPEPEEYTPFFARTQIETFEVRGATFWRIRGEGFKYEIYRDRILAEVRKRYYALPQWLPQCGCYFCDRYFPGQTCRR